MQNENLVVLIDSAGQLRRIKHYLLTNNIPFLKKDRSAGTYPLFYFLNVTENEVYAKMLESVTWFDGNGVKHSLFDSDKPYTDVVTLSQFFEKGGWVSCKEQ